MATERSKILNTNIKKVEENLFNTETAISLTYCVLEDFIMIHGIALTMRRKFGNISKLREQKKQVVMLEVENRIIFYIITKEHRWQKPTYHNLFQSLVNLRNSVENENLPN